ncbi:ABC transporter ATP-binding protein [Cohnella thailandensis]|uniref:ABC transporter ATP-binding protein n=1 Tax=Cohnella thailandensis TaxID=557557 RepID=A0A841SSE5_9BACL|nr:ABC transporter ATP-binding protein [Cohnella thailandensis]MBB6632985.1 ABC transporter ATP-binding protein [Cohnella thailandensis]MBP1975320.1 iron complex transport system ATP-binding protein [Cohnella thailandensis]
MSRLNTNKLSLAYGTRRIVNELNLSVPDGKITALVGSNGSGKSTILKSMARILSPQSGAVYLDGKEIHRQPTKEVAKQLAILPQNPTSPDGLTVRELVSFGRYPHQKGFGSLKPEDLRMVEWALEATGMSAFADRPVDQLSGGQRQRAWIAMAVAQGTEVLLLDEPTTFLDMAHQIEVMMLLEKLNKEQKRTIIMVVHDLNHAARYAQHMVALKQGTVLYEGNPVEVMTPEMLRVVFGIDADVIPDPRTGTPMCLPYGLAHEGLEEEATGAAGIASENKQRTQEAEPVGAVG